MPAHDDGSNESERLREALRRDAAHAPGAPIDLDAVLARTASVRRRRRGAVLGGTAAGVVVLAAGGYALSLWLGGAGPASTTAGAPEAGAPAPSEQTDASTGGEAVAPADQAPFASDLALAPLDRLNACGAEPAATAPVPVDGLELRVEAPAVLAPGERATAVVTLVNSGDAPFSGELRSGPALTIADDVTVWHTSGLELVREPIELAAGASASFEAELVAERCAASDEAGPALPPELPPLAPGAYRLSAAVSLAGLAGDETIGGTVLVAPSTALAVR